MTTAKRQTGPKFKSDTDKLRVLELISRYDGRGWSQWQIRDELEATHGVNLSQPMVGVYLKQARQKYEDAIVKRREVLVNEKLEQYRDIRREAWVAYDRSMEDSKKLLKEFVNSRDEVSPGEYVTSEVLMKRVVLREGRLPDNAYLNTIMKTLEAERELLAIDEMKAGTVTVEQVLQLVATIKDGIREVLAEHPALLKALMQRTSVALPALTDQSRESV